MKVLISMDQLDALERSAREALQLREALDWLSSQENIHWEKARGHFQLLRDTKAPGYFSRRNIGYGKTPLEAIQKAMGKR